jgi:HlyD family secretion protein
VHHVRATIYVHEDQINKIRQKQLVFIRFDNLPNERFKGYVNRISRALKEQSWMHTNQKQYPVDVFLTDKLPKGLHYPGISLKGEILVDMRENVVNVPIQSVSSFGLKQVILVVDNKGKEELREVVPGGNNGIYVEIKRGLKEGEKVSLTPPDQATATSRGMKIVALPSKNKVASRE